MYFCRLFDCWSNVDVGYKTFAFNSSWFRRSSFFSCIFIYFIVMIMCLLMFSATVLQFEGHSHASSVPECFTWVDSGGKGLLLKSYFYLLLCVLGMWNHQIPCCSVSTDPSVFDSFSNLPILKVMTQNPVCATVETTILDALHIMHNGKFLHLPVLDSGENFLRIWILQCEYILPRCEPLNDNIIIVQRGVLLLV